ncbi:MAG: cytochrome c biogenesis protein CcsA [Planctomycetes bacterium]|nr:cytochrome c biogenesis protein CcsA [Planctomycetota bacterium]
MIALLVHNFGGGLTALETWLMHAASLFLFVAALLAVLGLFWPRTFSSVAANIVAALGLAAFVWYFWLRFVDDGVAPLANAFEVLLQIATTILAGYFIWMGLKPQRHVNAWLFALAFLLTLSALLIGGSAGPASVGEAKANQLSHNPWLVAHIVFIILAVSMLTFATAVSSIYLLQDRTLRRKRDSKVLQSLPPLEALQRMVMRVMTVGFPTMTLALVFGFVVVWDELSDWIASPVILSSFVMWLVFLLAALGRFYRALGGRRKSWLVIIGYLLVILTYFGAGAMPGNHSFVGDKSDQKEEAK